ncbi:hypothetical protein ABZW11_18470 [Nonomuraea sp. NPDC004580]
MPGTTVDDVVVLVSLRDAAAVPPDKAVVAQVADIARSWTSRPARRHQPC